MRQHCFIRGKWASVVIVLVLVLSCCQNTKGDLDTPSDGVLVGNINVSNISVGENNATVHEKNETSSLKEEEHRNDSSSSRAEELFKKAMATRLKDHTSKEELRLSVHQLYAAAGIVHLSMNHSSASGYEMNGSLYYTADDVQVEWRNGTIQHIDAVRELIFAFRDGSGVPLNPAIAHRLVKELAAVGIAEFQADLGVLYSVGVEPVAPNDDDWLFVLKEPDLDLAMLHFSFAAKGDDPLAKMALGFRYYHGLGVEKSCPAALLYYEPVASSVVSAATVNGGLPTINDMRLGDKKRQSRPSPSAEQEFLHYQWFADYGHAEAARAVAHLLTHGEEQNLISALDYLLQAAEMGDADAMAHVGHAYANGIAVAQNNATARSWFTKAAEKGHPSGLFGLGLMHLTGQGSQVDHILAAKYFKRSIDIKQDWIGKSDAYFYAGLVRLHGWGVTRDVSLASQYFQTASKGGNLLASYNLAVLHLTGTSASSADACEDAVKLLKKVAERGWASLSEAADDYEKGDYSWSLYNYLKGASIGVELAQSNAAWLLRRAYGYNGPKSDTLAAYMLKLSAGQGNSGALIPLGDAYWYGRGVDVDLKRAGHFYTAASKRNNARALFNLGYMHQYGLGMPRDMHIAKRYYDQAMLIGPGTYLPNFLAVLWLRVHQFWDMTRPKLPNALIGLINPMFESDSTGAQKATIFGMAAYALHAPVKSLISLGKLFDFVDDAVDSSLLMWLVAILGLIVWRRRSTQHGAQQGRGDENNAQNPVNQAEERIQDPVQQD
eukprot:CAMPEP_0118801382 /NCGR_PEP_ID=MMETSP1161-20130426/2956_1 /TAXON_ID=249345 /ORGANISM="Picochlorum oklahomensis, Strain CCMP2329" /LENGTH=776 /DNA_ID=CAMNT_0006729307 /DNA_START=180 /DNA_END=2510 /DNA_ORIENTATION=+